MTHSPTFGSSPYFKLPKDPTRRCSHRMERAQPLRRLQLAHRQARRRRHRHRRARRRLGRSPTSMHYFQSLGQPDAVQSPTSLSTAPRTLPTRAARPGDRRLRSRARHRGLRRGLLRRHRPGRHHSHVLVAGHRLRRPKSRHRRLRCLHASPGARTKRTGAQPRRSRWNRPPQSAVADGMIVFAASGDNDSERRRLHSGQRRCPSSCPHVVGCGGTMQNLHRRRPSGTTIPARPTAKEPAAATRPSSPSRASRSARRPRRPISPYGKGRMVPDVCADADPNTGYNIYRPRIDHRGRRNQRRCAALRGPVRRLRNQARLRDAHALEKSEGLQRHHRGRQRILQRRRRARPVQRHRLAHRLRALPCSLKSLA